MGGFSIVKIEDYNRPKFKYEFIEKENRSIKYCKRKSGVNKLQRIYQSENKSGLNYPISIGGNFNTIWIKGIRGVRIIDTIDSDIVKFKAIKEQSNGVESRFSGFTHISNIQIRDGFKDN